MSCCAIDCFSFFLSFSIKFVLSPYLCILVCNVVNVYTICYHVHGCIPTAASTWMLAYHAALYQMHFKW